MMKIRFSSSSWVYGYICMLVLISVLFNSRAFGLGFIVSGVVYYCNSKEKRLPTQGIILLSFGLAACVAMAIFLIKKDSSSGRILIYKISWNIYKTGGLNGIGLGKFKNTYLYYQADYFRFQRYTLKELLLADNTYFLFNDYLQFIIEAGIRGCLILLLSIYYLFKLTKNAIRKNQNSILLWIIIVQLVALGIAACFDHIFYVTKYQLITCALLAVLSHYAFKGSVVWQSVSFGVLLGALVLSWGVQNHFSLRYYLSYKRLDVINQLYRSGYKSEAKYELDKNAKILADNEKYLELLSYIEFGEGDLDRAEKTTFRLLSKKVSSDIYIKLARIYEYQNKFKQAEAAYLEAIYMVPNRFKSRYLLYSLYKSNKKMKLAERCRSDLLSLPIKIKSDEINRIRKSILNNK